MSLTWLYYDLLDLLRITLIVALPLRIVRFTALLDINSRGRAEVCLSCAFDRRMGGPVIVCCLMAGPVVTSGLHIRPCSAAMVDRR
jgi:hypothetical protein